MITSLSDKEIMYWNDRLVDHQLGIFVKAQYNANTIFPAIEYTTDITRQVVSQQTWGRNLYPSEGESGAKVTKEPHIRYNLVFSIEYSMVDKFNKIYNIIKHNNLQTKVYLNDGFGKTVGTYRDINFDKLTIDFKNKQHTLYKKDYVKYDYMLEGNLGDIMGYVKFIEDSLIFLTIEPKFKISEVVSDVTNRSTDYLVLKYEYQQIGSKYSIEYIVSEILNDTPDTIIRYGKSTLMNEDQLTWSRTARIDEVINNE
jgi:hypothetical protein